MTHRIIKAVVFDIDGTLVDTSEFIMQSYEHTLAHHGLPKRTREEIARQVGKKLEDCYAMLAPGAEITTLLKVHRAFQEENLDLVKPFEYCNKVLERLKNDNIRLAFLTSRLNYVLSSLEKAGIDTELFDVIVDGSMVKKGKPDPEGIHLVLKKLGLQPDEVIMVGDAAVDILVGRAASLAATIGVTHGFGTREELDQVGADYILDSLQTLPQTISAI